MGETADLFGPSQLRLPLVSASLYQLIYEILCLMPSIKWQMKYGKCEYLNVTITSAWCSPFASQRDVWLGSWRWNWSWSWSCWHFIIAASWMLLLPLPEFRGKCTQLWPTDRRSSSPVRAALPMAWGVSHECEEYLYLSWVTLMGCQLRDLRELPEPKQTFKCTRIFSRSQRQQHVRL